MKEEKTEGGNERIAMDVAALQYRQVIWDLYEEWKAKNLSTFKFSVQPFTSRRLFSLLFPPLSSSFLLP